jgi:hypothetical protein
VQQQQFGSLLGQPFGSVQPPVEPVQQQQFGSLLGQPLGFFQGPPIGSVQQPLQTMWQQWQLLQGDERAQQPPHMTHMQQGLDD